MSITSNRVRFAADSILGLAFNPTIDKLTNRDIRFSQSSITDFEVSAFVNGVLDTTLTGILSATLIIKATTALEAAPLMSQTILAADFDLTTDLTTWNDGTKQQLTFSFTAAETNIALSGARSLDLYVYIFLTDANGDIQICAAPITLLDSGKGDLGVITVVPAGARMKSNKLQVRNPDDGLYYTVEPRTVNGRAVWTNYPTGEA